MMQTQREPQFEVIDAGNSRIVKAWKKGVQFDENTINQLKKTAQLPFIFKNICAMPDAHLGSGSTVGTVLPTLGAVCPATVGVDIGCGMLAARLNLKREDFAGKEATVRHEIERMVPAGRTNNGGQGDRGAWHNVPEDIQKIWNEEFASEYDEICKWYPDLRSKNTVNHLGTLGTGNHFIELAADEDQNVWIVLHSGSRGLGNKIGSYFTKLAQELCEKWFITLPDKDLAYLPEYTDEFRRYKQAVQFAQNFAASNRLRMFWNVCGALKSVSSTVTISETVNCHHNYISWERHYGQNVMVVRKGAVRAQAGDMGIIPGSMGAETFIVRGLGSQDSFCSCSHGAGRAMSRTKALQTITVEQHQQATQGIECDKTEGTLDESPAAYKNINSVMAAQSDLVEPVHTLKQFINVKGISDNRRR